MWVWQLGGDVHLEVVMVGDDGITQFQHCATLMLVCLRTINASEADQHVVDICTPAYNLFSFVINVFTHLL